MSGIVYWIWFSQRKGLRHRTRFALLERFGGPKELYFADEREWKGLDLLPEEEAALRDKDTGAAERILRRCGEEDVSVLTIQDAAYPERLKNIPDPPCVLYVKGHLPPVDTEAAIAVVGTRKCTPYGRKMARSVAYEIASGGGLVVTGLAEGVDSAAAEGALLAGKPVIGVLGTAINEVYPPFNGRLFDDVQAAGALLSEYPPDTPFNKSYFPRRNRIMAGLALGTVVVEAPFRSGSLITAHRALDYGRDVFAVPANADSPNARGSNRLIREGACLVENGWDVLKEYESRFPEKLKPESKPNAEQALKAPSLEGEKSPGGEGKPKKTFLKLRVSNKGKKAPEPPEEEPASALSRQLETLSENQLKIIGVMESPHMHIDDIIDLSRLPAPTVLSELTMLQIKGFVAQEKGKRFTLNLTK
ncbi:MAG: DNA-processing protein DprA [Oscillospiraceae bacterium]